MVTLGQRLRREREARGIALSEIAAATKIGRHHLEAIEHGEFDKLPGDVFTRGYVRAYAAHLGLDGGAAVEEFRRERCCTDGCDVETTDVVPEMARLLGANRERADRTRHLHRVLVIASAAVLATGAATVIWLGSSRVRPPMPTAARATPLSVTPVRREVQPAAPPAPTVSDPRPRESIPAPPPPDSADASALAVTRHGVGDGVRDRELTGESDRFAEGTAVWFWTLVEGGAPGVFVEHVWIHGGRETHRILLPIGASRWRTQSHKTIRNCDDGVWAVEARDAQGRVLARSTFACTG